MAAAAEGALTTPAAVRQQARRLLAQPGTSNGLLRFFKELLRYNAVTNLVKSQKRYPDYDEQLRRDLRQETELFLQQALWKEDGTWRTLLAGEFTMANERVARFHGLDGAVTGSDFRRIPTPRKRAGLLMQASLLATLSGDSEANAIMRGGFIRRELLCGHVPDPPADLMVMPIKDDGKRTNREQYAQHSADQRCVGCHQMLDPLGFPLEIFDAIGRRRDVQNGKPIDPSGYIKVTEASDGPVKDAFDLAEKLGASPDARSCAVRHLYQYLHARAVESADACALEALAKDPMVAAGNVREIVAAMVADQSFLTRGAPPASGEETSR
jgi:hypothetical protein